MVLVRIKNFLGVNEIERMRFLCVAIHIKIYIMLFYHLMAYQYHKKAINENI